MNLVYFKWILSLLNNHHNNASRVSPFTFFSFFTPRMSTTLLVPGMIIGGVVISSIGAGSTYFLEEKHPSFKSLARDFIIGAIMVMMILQLLPESSSFLIEYLMALVPLSLFKTVQTGGESDMEVKVGVPRF